MSTGLCDASLVAEGSTIAAQRQQQGTPLPVSEADPSVRCPVLRASWS